MRLLPVVLALVIQPIATAAQETFGGATSRHPTGAPTIAPAGLVAAYDMATTTADGRLRDFGPGSHHGEILRSRTAPGPNGTARLFDDVLDRVHLPEGPALAIDGPLTLATWVRVSTLGLHQHLIACDDKFALWITPQNRMRFSDTLGHGSDTADPLAEGQWYSLVAVFDGEWGTEVTTQSVRLYVNGVRAATTPVNRTGDTPARWTPGALYPNDACYIGFESHQGNEAHQRLPFVGFIDDLMIFRRALTEEEVAVHARAGSQGERAGGHHAVPRGLR